MKNPKFSGRKIIGVLIDWTVDPYQQILLSGIMDAAKKRGVNCIVFEGGAVGSPYEHETLRNGIYRLASGLVVDGLVVLSASIAQFIGKQETQVFCSNFHPLPLVSVSMEIENATSVLSDNRPGMRDLLTHLVERHGYKRFGFVKGRNGNQDAEERFDVFLEILRERQLPLLSPYLYQGDFTMKAGIEAAKDFVEKGINGIDVIVTANDNMARGVIEELSRAGVRVPEQMAVTGFDDLDSGDSLFPLLSTVHQPIYEQGATAAGLLMDILDHKEVPSKVYVPTRMVIRESCRCSSDIRPSEERTGDARTAQGEGENSLQLFRQLMPSLLASRTDIDPETMAHKMDQAWKKIAAGEDPTALVTAFRKELYHPVSNSADFFTFEKMIGKLWNHRLLYDLRPSTESAIQDRLLEAILAVCGDQFERKTLRVNEFLQERHKLEVIRELLFSMDLAKQMDVLRHHIPNMGINSCYISLFTDQPEKKQEKAACILAIRNKQWIDPEVLPKEFPPGRLVPDDFLSDPGQHMLIVEAMKEIGFIVFEMGEKPDRFYPYLSDIICGAVQASVIYTALEDQRNSLDSSLTHMRKAMAGFIQTMSATVETRDPYTAGHQRRVSDLARTIATGMGLSASEVDCVRMAGIIHDLGKIYIPAEILNRAGVLDEIEWSMIKKHPKVAWDILKNIEFPWPIAEIVHQHHERINGKGYPNGLAGDAICLEARILAVADVVEAMSSHRPYREALGIEKALEEINKNKGILYDPKVVDVCTELFRVKGYKFHKTAHLRNTV